MCAGGSGKLFFLSLSFGRPQTTFSTFLAMIAVAIISGAALNPVSFLSATA
jgi:hypothetical protein